MPAEHPAALERRAADGRRRPTFHGDLAPVVDPDDADAAAAERAPRPRRDALDAVQACASACPFPVEYPTVLESSSNLDTATGRRRCGSTRSAGTARRVRLTFRDGPTASTGASRRRTGPTRRCSTDKSVTQRVGGRELRALLHRRAPAHGRAARRTARRYWVVNTLLDSLSNETMLAIARGLRPLPHGRLRRAEKAENRHLRRRLGRPRHRRLLRRARPRGRRPRRRARADRGARRRAACRSTSPASTELLERNRERLTLHARRRRRRRRAPSPVRLRRHAADLLRRRRPVRGLDGRSTSCRRSRSAPSS